MVHPNSWHESDWGRTGNARNDYAFSDDQKGDRTHTVFFMVTRDQKSKCSVCVRLFLRKQCVRDIKKFEYPRNILTRTDGESQQFVT